MRPNIQLIVAKLFFASVFSCSMVVEGYAAGSAKPSKESFNKAFGKERGAWALDLFEQHRKKSRHYNQEYFVFVDLKRHVSKRRFYLVYPHQDKALGYKVTHGYGSDPNRDGYVDRVGDVMHSGMSSEGVFVTKGIKPSAKFGYTVHLCGLSRTNKKAHSRLLRVHPAKDKNGKDYLARGEMSAGCFAVNIDAANDIYQLIGHKQTLIISSFSDSFK